MTDTDVVQPLIELNVEGLGSTTVSKSASSTQLPERRIRSLRVGVRPPYNPDRLAAFTELNETLATGVRKKSRYEVGFGFELTPHAGVDPDEADEIQQSAARQFWFGRDSRWQTRSARNAEPATPQEVLELARQDYHTIGWSCLEILVDLEGRPVGLAHVPANTVRVRKPQDTARPRHPETGRFIPDDDTATFASRGYVQVRDQRRRYFGEAGDRYRGLEVSLTDAGDDGVTITYQEDDTDDEPVFVDRETGDVAVGSAEDLENRPANEIIFVRNPSILEQDYGIPDWVSAIRTITSDEAAKDYNRDFFRNDTIPRVVVKVTGGTLSEQSREDLQNMLRNLREEGHRAVVLEPEKFLAPEDRDLLDEDGFDIEIEPIGLGISEEMDFKAYREKNEHEIAKVLEVPPIKIGVTATSNRSNSEVQDREFALEVIQPEQRKFAERLYQLIHQQALGVLDWTVEFALRGAEQPKRMAEVAERKIRAVQGAVTINQGRELAGLDPLPADHPSDPDETLLAELGGDGSAPGGGEERHAHAPPPENRLGYWEWDDVRADVIELADLAKQPQNPIDSQQFVSSNLDSGIFDFFENNLWLSFERDGPPSIYVYTDVSTAEWQGLVTAASHGSYHYHNIRLEYPYWEVTNNHERLPEGQVPDDIPEGVPEPADD